MLTLVSWKKFWVTQCFGVGVFLVCLSLWSLLLSSEPTYLGQNLAPIVYQIVLNYSLLVVLSTLKIMAFVVIFCCFLQCCSSFLSYRYKYLFGMLFFGCLIVRTLSWYPAISEKWFFMHHLSGFKSFVQDLSLSDLHTQRRWLLNWSPFIVCLVVFLANVVYGMAGLISLARSVQKARNSIYVDKLDRASKQFAMRGFAFFLSVCCGGVGLSYLNCSMDVPLPRPAPVSKRPHVFLFAIDSLRYDRLSDPKFAHIMPYLSSRLAEATFFAPMQVGVPRTFPSWVEIARGQLALKTGVRTMFPNKHVRQGLPETIFQTAAREGYATVFVSDFAGDIFSRYPFGGQIIDAPSSDLGAFVENGVIDSLAPVHALLTLPKLSRVFVSVLECLEVVDPRLVAGALVRDMDLAVASPIDLDLHRAQGASGAQDRPIFLTAFFSAAHFPYASPGPWYGLFQNPAQPMAFEKLPDQALGLLSGPVPESTKARTIALYDGGLRAVDDALADLMPKLQKQGWLDDAIVMVFGDHGENLYDGDLGMGHGDTVLGEYANSTPLIIWTTGSGRPSVAVPLNTQQHLPKTVDIAPTLARRLGLPFAYEQSDGMPLLDEPLAKPHFPPQNAYTETGLWFTPQALPGQQDRVQYPGVFDLLQIDKSWHFEFALRSDYNQPVLGVKERSWSNAQYKLLVRTTLQGVRAELYDRRDTAGQHNLLLLDKHFVPIAQRMQAELDQYLMACGVERIPSADGSFFYGEHTIQ